MATVLIVGATGNIGVSVATAALRSKVKVLAIVRNQTSAEKLFKHVGTREGITTVTADVMSENGVQSVVDQVKAGKLPAFQHVYSTVGYLNPTTPLQDIPMSEFRHTMNTNLEANFFAYRATIPYLLNQNHAASTWTLVTGGLGETGGYGVTAISQGALFSLANAASLENAKTNVRFNEVFLNLRVDYDSVVDESGDSWRMKTSEFAKVYEGILAKPEIKGCRVTVASPQDVQVLKYEKKLRE